MQVRRAIEVMNEVHISKGVCENIGNRIQMVCTDMIDPAFLAEAEIELEFVELENNSEEETFLNSRVVRLMEND